MYKLWYPKVLRLMQFDSGGVGKILVYINVLIYPYLTRFLFMKPTKFRSVKLYIDQKGNTCSVPRQHLDFQFCNNCALRMDLSESQYFR